MHPIIRVVTFFVFSLSMAFGHALHLVLAAVLLVLGYILEQKSQFTSNWLMLKRMRWLFLSIFIVYFWFTPGEPLISAIQNYSPSVEGIRMGFYRVCSLIFIVLAVTLLVRTIEKNELVSSILWLLKPLHFIGFPHERLAVRMALTLDYVIEVQDVYTSKSDSNQTKSEEGDVIHGSETNQSQLSQRLNKLSESSTQLFEKILQRAKLTESHEIIVKLEYRPPVLQWCYPAVLTVVSIVFARV